MRLALVIAFAFLLHPVFLHSQSKSELFINSNSGLEKTLSSLVNDLNLSNEQKIVIGIIILKYGLGFNYSEFDKKSDVRKYAEIKSLLKAIEKEMRPVLTKEQYKIYKKKKRALKKELMRNN